jgi:hypothetical protein
MYALFLQVMRQYVCISTNITAPQNITSHSISNNFPSIIFLRFDQKLSQRADVGEVVSSLKDFVSIKLVPLGTTSLASDLSLLPDASSTSLSVPAWRPT